MDEKIKVALTSLNEMKIIFMDSEKTMRFIENSIIESNFDINDEDIMQEIAEIQINLDDIMHKLNKDFAYVESIGFTRVYGTLLYSLLTKISKLKEKRYSLLSDINKEMKHILEEIESVKTLNKISDVDNTVVLIGANGSGKSSYVNNLKKVSLPNLFVIPAQKYLYFDKNTSNRNEATILSYQNFMYDNNIIEITRKTENKGYIRYDEFKNSLTYPFTYLITALVKEYAEIAVNKDRGIKEYLNKEPLWNKLENIWSQLIPNIEFNLDPNERTISIKKNNQSYNLNGLSDGEKCILFYIGNALVAPENSYIVIDEPETFLNPAIYNKLWDLIISMREDCQFIFTSHTMDFINARANSSFVWCKSFTYPDQFELQLLDEAIDFPMSLLTELVGSRKPILFCEGTYDSIDYQLFSKVFMNNFFVKPVGGHKDIINYTKGYNEIADVHGNKAYGIIDGDFLKEEVISSYRRSNVFVLPFNEIEMVLVTETIITYVLEPFEKKSEISKKIQNFKNTFFEELETFKNKIIFVNFKFKLAT